MTREFDDRERAATLPADELRLADQADDWRGRVGGSAFSSTADPVGRGSNTPVGDEPRGFQSWDTRVDSPWRSRIGFVLAPAGIAASAGLYGLWRRRQARRGRLAGVSRVVASAGGSVAPVLDAARERGQSWWLAPLAALPLALYLRSTQQKTGLDELAKRAPTGRWRNRLSSLELERPRSIRPLPLWTLAIPVGAAAISVAWYAVRARGTSGPSRRLGDIMTRGVEVIQPETSVYEAASLMKRFDIGSLPVCDGQRLKGMLTDRDIVVRPIADSRDPRLTPARDAMTAEVVSAYEDEPVQRGAELMRRHRIRRLPIVDREKRLVGIVALGDLAVDVRDDRLSGAALERISEPSQPKR